MEISNSKTRISKWANIRSACLLVLAMSPFVSTGLNAQEATPIPSGPADPTRASKEMRHLVPASVKEIREACPDVSCEFILQQIEAGATIFEVRDAYHRLLSERLERLTEENTKLRAGRRSAPSVTTLPLIRLRSKVVTDEKSNVALLEIDKQLVRVRTGQDVRISSGGRTVTIRAEEISTRSVRLLIVPLNLQMEL